MNQISAHNNLKIKGKMPLCVGLHGGVIAFGNALGNSIVEGMSKPPLSERPQLTPEMECNSFLSYFIPTLKIFDFRIIITPYADSAFNTNALKFNTISGCN